MDEVINYPETEEIVADPTDSEKKDIVDPPILIPIRSLTDRTVKVTNDFDPTAIRIEEKKLTPQPVIINEKTTANVAVPVPVSVKPNGNRPNQTPKPAPLIQTPMINP